MFSSQVYSLLKDTSSKILFRNLSMQLVPSLLKIALSRINFSVLRTDK